MTIRLKKTLQYDRKIAYRKNKHIINLKNDKKYKNKQYFNITILILSFFLIIAFYYIFLSLILKYHILFDIHKVTSTLKNIIFSFFFKYTPNFESIFSIFT